MATTWPSRAERLAAQDALEREYAREQATRPNVSPAAQPDAASPEFCVVAGSHRHSMWTSKKDHKRRCYYCCACFDPATGQWRTAAEEAAAPIRKHA